MAVETRPLLVLISDIHFNINTLKLATASLTSAIAKANELQVPLVIAGDLHDTKAIIRAEVANSLIDILSLCKTRVTILVGNHDLINEKGLENGLNYLKPYAIIQHTSHFILPDGSVYGIPYQSDPENLKYAVDKLKSLNFRPTFVIMHQGFLGAAMGDYIQDKSSVDPSLLKDYTVISGHYHRHQTISTVTYVGSPYTITFGEANDGPKGFLVLHSDGTFTREILNLRKHIIVETNVEELISDIYKDRVKFRFNTEDLIWIKVKDVQSKLNNITKDYIAKKHIGHSNFKLDLIPYDLVQNDLQKPSKPMTDMELLDSIIDETNETQEQKQYLKRLSREVIES